MLSQRQIDELCERFQILWQSGNRPSIEEFAGKDKLEGSPELFARLLRLEYQLRREYGESDAQLVDEFQQRFPSHPSDIEKLTYYRVGSDASTADLRTGGTPTPPVEPHLPPYLRILDRVGRGGFGTVYRALDERLNRIVAIKIPHASQTANERDRFLKEARLAARLSHPGIVPVFEVGETIDGPFIVSEYVDGPTLAQSLASRKFGLRETARMIAAVAQALDYAHNKGVVHRDLKPSNLIFQSNSGWLTTDEISGDTSLRILDFGLARDTQDANASTATGQVVGTPDYMSPEQARGQAHRVDARSDIYSLGVILYRLLWDKIPHASDIATKPKAKIPQELATICHKCLAENPDNRYQSAAQLSEDLLNWLEYRPILAKPATRFDRLRKWIRRHPQSAVASTILLVAVAISGAVLKRQWDEGHRARQRMVSARIDAVLLATDEQLSRAVDGLREILPQATNELNRRFQTRQLSTQDEQRLRIALWPDGGGDVIKEWEKLAQTADVAEMQQLLAATSQLSPDQRDHLIRRLWSALESSRAENLSDHAWIRIAAALASLDPNSEKFARWAPEISSTLLSLGQQYTDRWAVMFRPIYVSISDSLQGAFIDGSDIQRSTNACHVLAILCAARADQLVDLLQLAQQHQVPLLVAAMKENKVGAVPHLNEVLTAPTPPADDNAEHEDAIRARANVAVALLALGHETAVWPYLQHFHDPRMQTYIIHQAADCGVSSAAVVRRLEKETDPGAIYALLLLAGQYSENGFLRNQISDKVLNLYRSHPDVGVHAAAAWLLQTWGMSEAIATIDKSLMEQGVRSDRNWFVNKLGMCMTIVAGPNSFTMGSPRSEANRHAYEELHEQQLLHSFAISCEEVTFDHMKKLGLEFPRDRMRAPSDRCPLSGVTWEEVVDICQRLSDLEALATDVRPITSVGAPPEGDWQIDLRQPGYRLPTSAEWEFACRAGTVTSRSFGSCFTPFADRYGWYSETERLSEVGLRMPNRLGLFDCYGNVQEWVIGRYRWSEKSGQGHTENGTMVIKPTELVMLRGGSYMNRAAHFRSAWWTPTHPGNTFHWTGFRIARTLVWQ